MDLQRMARRDTARETPLHSVLVLGHRPPPLLHSPSTHTRFPPASSSPQPFPAQHCSDTALLVNLVMWSLRNKTPQTLLSDVLLFLLCVLLCNFCIKAAWLVQHSRAAYLYVDVAIWHFQMPYICIWRSHFSPPTSSKQSLLRSNARLSLTWSWLRTILLKQLKKPWNTWFLQFSSQ